MEVFEAIKQIRKLFDYNVYGVSDEAVRMAINALEKQIPKVPILWENKTPESPIPNDDWGYECPCCGNRDIDYPDKICQCGQSLDFSPFDPYSAAIEAVKGSNDVVELDMFAEADDA